MFPNLPLVAVGLKFLQAWVPLQFKAWQNAQVALGRQHPDKGVSWSELPDSVKQMTLQFIPLQMALLREAGRASLISMREAGRNGDRMAVQNLIEELAERYHDAWYVVRELMMTNLQQPPKRRTDDMCWEAITEAERQVVREIIWQWCLVFADDLCEADFERLCGV